MADTRCMLDKKTTLTHAHVHAHLPGPPQVHMHVRAHARARTHKQISNTYCFSTAKIIRVRYTCIVLLSLLTTHNTNIHAPGGIRTRNPSKRSAAGPRVKGKNTQTASRSGAARSGAGRRGAERGGLPLVI